MEPKSVSRKIRTNSGRAKGQPKPSANESHLWQVVRHPGFVHLHPHVYPICLILFACSLLGPRYTWFESNLWERPGQFDFRLGIRSLAFKESELAASMTLIWPI